MVNWVLLVLLASLHASVTTDCVNKRKDFNLSVGTECARISR